MRAAFTATRGDRNMVLEMAIEFASRLPSRNEVIVEDQTGNVWENEASLRASRVED